MYPDTYWNFRVIRMVSKDEVWFEIKEVHYEDDKPVGYGDSVVMGDSVESIGNVLDVMKKALNEPVLEATYFE